jgi:hypothetical protein
MNLYARIREMDHDFAAMADEFAQAFVLPGETCPNRTLRVAML